MTDVASPLTTITIPTYNRAELLQRAISSVQAQDHPAMEILIVIRMWVKQWTPRLRPRRQAYCAAPIIAAWILWRIASPP